MKIILLPEFTKSYFWLLQADIEIGDKFTKTLKAQNDVYYGGS